MTSLDLPLTLRRRRDDAGEPSRASAWFIPGADVGVWLDEIAAWGVAVERVRVCVVPRSAGDRRACGVVAILPKGVTPERAPSPLAQAYQCVVGRVYLPAGARLHPPVGDAELEGMLLYPVQVFHPAVGIVGFGEEDVLLGTDLLAAPPEEGHEWGRADPGVPPAPAIRAVMPEARPTIEGIVEDGRDDIGSEAAEDLPPLPEESPLRNLAAKSAIGALGALSWLAKFMPGGLNKGSKGAAGRGAGKAGGESAGGAAGGWGDRVRQWSAARMAALRASIERARRKELSRLLDLLERNVDEALKYALPLTGTPGRGVAPPGWQLGARSTDFDASRIGRSGRVDAWDTGDYHAKLAAKYREAANRELALGRYRRAAYVFAQLLGDYGAAANALRQGRFFREAATLYLEQLKNDALAAECLEAGGLLLEAIGLYEKLGRQEKVGDLYTTIERAEDARRHYRRAVGVEVARGDLLGAARLLETKLAAPDGALAMLERGWPQSHKAGACLREVFELLGRLGRHEAAKARLARLRPELGEGSLALVLADVLPRVASAYPNSEVRARAADATRVVVGNRLASGDCGAAEMRTLTGTVMGLAPEDRLLARDANRYPASVARPATPPPVPIRGDRKLAKTEPTLVHAFHLGAGTTVRTVYPEGDHFFAVAARGEQVLMIRGQWDGTFRSTWRYDARAAETFYRIERARANGPALYAIPLRRANAPLPPDIGPDPGFLEFYLQLPPDYQDGGELWDLCRDENDVLWTLRLAADFPGLALTAHDASGRLISSEELAELDPGAIDTPTALVVRRGLACVLAGDGLYCGRKGRGHFITVEGATDMRVSNPHVVPRVVVTFEEGAMVVWPEDGHSVRFGQGLMNPVACFTGGGELVAVGRGRGMTLRVERDGVKRVRSFEYAHEPPLAICPAGDGDRFAMFLPDGLVRVMRLAPD